MSMLGLGGIPDRRVDQRLLGQSRAGVGPAPQTGTFIGRLVIIFGTGANTGLFVYSPTPGAGNLVASIAANAGTDPYGNAYPAGITSYGTAFGDSMATIMTAAGFNFRDLTRYPANWADGLIKATPLTPGSELNLISPAVSGAQPASVLLKDSSGSGSGQPQALIGPTFATGNGTAPTALSGFAQMYVIGGLYHLVTGAGIDGGIPATQSDASSFTITTTGANQASKAWSIPANDANAGTLYRLTVWGNGTEGSTAENLVVGAGVDGTSIRTATVAALTLSGAFKFKVSMILHVTATGATGHYDLGCDGSWDTTASPGVAGPFTFGSATSGAEAIDTTVAHTFRLNLGWSAVTGAPTITTFASLFERLGP